MVKDILLILLFSYCTSSFSQVEKIQLIDRTFKLKATEEKSLHIGLAEGDILKFEFSEKKSKELKEIEVTKYGSSTIFSDYKSIVLNKEIEIPNSGVYVIRLNNGSFSGRICSIKLSRIPKDSSTIDFNTTVYWGKHRDTTYKEKKEKYLVRVDTSVVKVTDQVAKVHSSTNLNGNKTVISFTLPQNTVKWTYYLGVDQASQEIYEEAVEKLAEEASGYVAAIPGYGPLAALALGSASYLTKLQRGEDIDYYLVDNDNVNLFRGGYQFNYFKTGKVINDFSVMLKPSYGMYNFCLVNDNAVTGVSVNIKVVAIVVKKTYGEKIVKIPVVKESNEPYLDN